MSGDVQPRKRKDKKKKRDDESSHGVHITKMGSDDVHLHVHEEHGTGGHWCAKIIFFSLMTILMGLVCLIILENRGISDVDTPLSESRFSNYFDGWVDEHRDDHDDHHDAHGSLEHDDDHDDEHDDDHDEPFEEEADHSEGDEEVEEEVDENVTPEEEDQEEDDNVTAEVTAEEDDEDEEEYEGTVEEEADDNATAENQDDDDDNLTAEIDDDNVTEEATVEQNDDDEEDNVDDNNTNEEDDNATTETSKPTPDEDDPFDEEDDDGTFESIEKVVDNDAAELELLKEKARQQAAAEAKNNAASLENDNDDEAENAPSWASSQIRPKTGGGGPQSYEDDDDLFEQELRRANDEMMREHYAEALKSFDQLIQKYPTEPQTYLGKAQTLDYYAEQQKSNRLLLEAIEYYKTYLIYKANDNYLHEYQSAAERCLERMRFLGQYHEALPIHQLLIKQFPQEPSIRNELAVTYLMQNRLLDAKMILKEILKIWPDNGFALVHYGFVLKQLDHDYLNASKYLQKGIESNDDGTQDGRFYFQLGESLQRLGKQHEAVEIYRKGADLQLFRSIYQRSLYNEPYLKAQPFWSLEETTYEIYLKILQDNWLAIKAEGLHILSKTGYFQDESENLKNTGDWKQFELYARGQQKRQNCMKAPITCNLIAQFPAARDCLRGQVKFSVMHENTHVWPHCGPTNCRLRAHLGLVVPQGTRIRVAEEERSWQEGKFLIFDDSFEHEVWHEGEGLRLVLIVDMWHPDLSEQKRRSLSPI